MDFAFSEEQEMLREQARSFLADKFPLERLNQLVAAAWDEKAWRHMAELGWMGLSVPEESGGAGMSFLDEAVLFEEMGYGLFPGPFFSTVAMALPASAGAGDLLRRLVSGEAAATVAWAEEGAAAALDAPEGFRTEAHRDGDAWRLSGTKHLIPDLDKAGRVVVVARSPEGTGLWDVDPAGEGAVAEVLSTMDETRRLGRLRLENAPGACVAEPGSAGDLLRGVHLRALAALALEAVGVAQRALDGAVDYAKNRKQFDKPIGTYQAVAHKLSDAYVEVELARSLAYWGAWCVAEGDEQAPVAAPAAKGFAADAAVDACERSIQVHGGIGFTEEHVLHRFYKRAQWIAAFSGSGAAQRGTVASSLLGP